MQVGFAQSRQSSWQQSSQRRKPQKLQILLLAHNAGGRLQGQDSSRVNASFLVEEAEAEAEESPASA
jgi:hypothetical protein